MIFFYSLFYFGWMEFYDVLEKCFKEFRIVGYESLYNFYYLIYFVFLDIVILFFKKMKERKKRVILLCRDRFRVNMFYTFVLI